MLVKEHIFRKAVSIDVDEPIHKAIKLIFNHNVSLLPVTKERELVGVIAEKDILNKLLPSMKEFIENATMTESFEAIEKRLPDYMHQPVSMIMNDSPYKVTMDTPLLKAQSMMLRNNFHRAPIVNEKNHVIGVISQGDIFRALAGQSVQSENDDFHEWYATFYNLIEPVKKKQEPEIKALSDLFREHNVYRVVDVFCGDGSHAIGLAAQSFEVLGLNKFKHFHEQAMNKMETAFSKSHRGTKPTFLLGDYLPKLEKHKQDFDAAILMGNALSHHPNSYKEILEALNKSIVKKNGVLVIQITNNERILNDLNRIQYFKIVPSVSKKNTRYAFLEFFNEPDMRKKEITYSVSILKNTGETWEQDSVNSTPLAYLDDKILTKMLKDIGFKKIQVFGSKYYEHPFKQKFDKKQHDWINLVATR